MRRRPFPWIPTLVVLLFSVFSLAAFRYWLGPLAEEVVARDLVAREEIWRAHQEEQTRRRQQAREVERARREVVARERWLAEVVPATIDPEATLSQATSWAEEEGLAIVAAEADPVEPGDPLASAALRVALRGDPAAAQRWLERVASGIPLVAFEDLSIELRGGDPRDEGEAGPPTVDLRADLRIFGDAAAPPEP